MPEVATRVQVPSGLTFYAHQSECIRAFHEGSRWSIWRHHRQSGKGLAALALTAQAAFERPGTFAIVSPTFRMSRETFWDARDPRTGAQYLDVIPPEIVLEKNENQQALVMATQVAGRTSRIVFGSADDPDRLRGLALAGCVLDEFATMESAEPLHIVRASLAASGGWLLITSTPKGMNHFYDVWKNAEAAGGWYLSTKTIEDTVRHDGTPIIATAHVEQERAEGQAEEWLQQEFYVAFTAALASSYYGPLLTAAEAEGRVLDLPYRPDYGVLTAWDLGIRDSTAILYVQDVSPWLDVLRADEYTGLGLPDILAKIQEHHYRFVRHLAPHDLEQRDYGTGITRRAVAERLGVEFEVQERLPVAEGIDAVRRLFPRLRFDRRGCARLLQALSEYSKVWDAKGKVFKDAAAHTWASHLADALRTLATGYPGGGPLIEKPITVVTDWDLRQDYRPW